MPFEAASRGLFEDPAAALKTWTAPVPSPLAELRLDRVLGKRRSTGESAEEGGTEAESEGAEERIRVRLKRPGERKVRGKTADLTAKSTPSLARTMKAASDLKQRLPFKAGASTRLYSPSKQLSAQLPLTPSFLSSPRLKQGLHLPIKAAFGLTRVEKSAGREESQLETLRRGPIELRSGLRSARWSAEQSHEGEAGLGASGYTPKSALVASDWQDLADLIPRTRVPVRTPRPKHFPV